MNTRPFFANDLEPLALEVKETGTFEREPQGLGREAAAVVCNSSEESMLRAYVTSALPRLSILTSCQQGKC